VVREDIPMTFEQSLTAFVHAWIAEEEAARRSADTLRRLEAEIRWCRQEIAKEERRARRQPRAARRVAELVHQIRRRELEIAFRSLQ